MARETTQFTLPISGALGTAFSVYFRNIVPFTVLTALVLSPWIALRVLATPETQGEAAGINLAAALLQMILSFVLTGALTYGVVQQLRGTPASPAAALAQGVRTFFRVLGTGLLASIRIFLFTLLLIIPGIIETVRLFIAIPAAVMEGNGAGNSIDRSVRLTSGSKWQIFGVWFVIYVLIGVGLPVLVGFISVSLDPDMLEHLWWFDTVFPLVTAPLLATTASVVYFMLRQGKENVAVDELAKVFD